MLVIRDDQYHKLQEAVEHNLVKRIAKDIRKHYTQLVSDIDDNQLEDLVSRGIGCARANGFTFENDLADFVGLMFLVAPNFDQHPTVIKALQEKYILPENRMGYLLRVVKDSEWIEARENWDGITWV